MGQAAHEADRVRQQYEAPGGEGEAAHGGVERGEEAVFDQHVGAGEAVEQARLAGVGVADKGRVQAGAAAGLAPGGPVDPQGVDLVFEDADALLDLAAVADALWTAALDPAVSLSYTGL